MKNNTITGSVFHRQSIDQATLYRKLVVAGLFLLTVVTATMVLKTNNYVFMGGLIALPFVLILTSYPKFTLMMAIVLDATGLQMPGLSYSSLGLLARLVVVGTIILGAVLGAKYVRVKRSMPEAKPLVFFFGIIVLLMAVRGAGLRMLGGETWGGMIYVNLIAGIVFYRVINGFTLTRKQIRFIIFGSIVTSIIGAFLSRAGWNAVVEAGSAKAARLIWLRYVAVAVLPVAFALKIKGKPWVNGLLILLAFGMIGLTGYRSQMIGFLMMALGYGFFKSKKKAAYCVVMVFVGLIAWAGLLVISPRLPEGIQRSISFVPGLRVAEEQAANAENSIEWRLEIWKHCLGEARQYLLIGRGSAFNAYEASENLSTHDIQTFSPWFAFLTRSYHSGPLSLLIDYGLPGLIVALWLTVLAVRRFWGYSVKLAKMNTLESRYALFLSVQLIWGWIAFYLIFGSMPDFSKLVTDTAVAIVIVTSVFSIEQKRIADQMAREQDLQSALSQS